VMYNPEVLEMHQLAPGQVPGLVPLGGSDLGERPHLVGGRSPAGDPNPDHEEAGGRGPEKQAIPFQTLDVALRNRFPARPGVLRDGVLDLQAIALLLELFDLVHAEAEWLGTEACGARFASGVA